MKRSLHRVLSCSLMVGVGALFPMTHAQNATNLPAGTVRLLVTVRDNRGKIVSDLGKDDFVLTQDDRPQTLQSVEKNASGPLTLGVLFQTSQISPDTLDRERSASHDFLDQMLREDKDRAFIMHFDQDAELLRDLTNSRDKLFNALGLLQSSGFEVGERPSRREPEETRDQRPSGSVLYDAIYLACDEVLKSRRDRKALVVFSDGIDEGSKETVGSAIEAAQDSDTVIYTILVKNEPEARRGLPGGMGRGGSGPPERPHPDARKVLQQISKETGGEFFDAGKKQTGQGIYAAIEEDLRHEYGLSYTPEISGDWSGLHKIVLTTKRSDLVVHVKEGFHSEKSPSP